MHNRIREKISNGPVGRGLHDVTRRQFSKNGEAILSIDHTRRMASAKCSRATTSRAGQTLYPIAMLGKGSGQTPIAVWSQPVQEFLGPVIGLEWR